MLPYPDLWVWEQAEPYRSPFPKEHVMPKVLVVDTVQTPGHLASERHPAVVAVNPHPNYHPRVYVHYEGAPAAQPTTYHVDQRAKHDHPCPQPIPVIP